MSGGISAIKGFDYQALVILDRLFDHFDRHGNAAEARPEGIDDLDLSWAVGSVEHRRYEQIKKPTEDVNGNLKPTSWTLSDVIRELLPNTFRNLVGNSYAQIWLLGDDISPEVNLLMSQGKDAPISAAREYWKVVHGLARNHVVSTFNMKQPMRQKFQRLRIPLNLPTTSAEILVYIFDAFSKLSETLGCATGVSSLYQAEVAHLHRSLPSVLSRIEILPAYGTSPEVMERVFERLVQKYKLERSVVQHTLFRNLLGFINDISKQPGRTFNLEELEFELRCVWPRMIPIRSSPTLDVTHIRRPDLADRVTTKWTGKAIEAIGISGSGKTMLAAEITAQSNLLDPERLVYYAEARIDVTLRDVLAGVAFHLRRIGIVEPFSISVNYESSDEEILVRLAKAYSSTTQRLLILIDLADGACSSSFARDLAKFIKSLSPSICRIVIFSQESSLREFNSLDRDEHGVSRIDIRGFRFEEFTKLVSEHHPKSDRSILWDIYQRITAGRASGLFAKLAQSLARTTSIDEMFKMASRPADDILAHSEQQRFLRISESARSAAERLVCFALPFRRKDAEDAFSDVNIGSAIRELLTQGLLSTVDDDRFEMHETVRAGLEGLISVAVRYSAHEALAALYGVQGLVTAEILHLEKTGNFSEAHRRARDSFLLGERWSALSAYITNNKLVSAQEVIDVVANDNPVEDLYLFSNILRALTDLLDAESIFQILRKQPARFYSDYRWALAITNAILDFSPSLLHDLILFSIESSNDMRERESALSWLAISARQKSGILDSRTIDFFRTQQTEIKKLLLRFLLLDHRREYLAIAFQFLASSYEEADRQPRYTRTRDISLQLDSLHNAVEFLAAIPSVEAASMLLARSALLGSLENIVWNQKKFLRIYCIEILQDNAHEKTILINAIRVLIFLAESSVGTLIAPFLDRKDEVGTFARLVPPLIPTFCDHAYYEGRLLDCTAPFQERMSALFVLASVGINLSELRQRINFIENDPTKIKKWNDYFLLLCVQTPFPDGIPLLEERLLSLSEEDTDISLSMLTKLGELPVPAATEMLVRALSHPIQKVRKSSALALTYRRSHLALQALIDQYGREKHSAVAVVLATAIVASGPKNAAALQSTPHQGDAFLLWQFILAMRSNDASMADRIISVAIDSTKNWQLRRIAIFSASRLPYELALEKIVPHIMAERTPLTIDKNPGFQCHALMSFVVMQGASGLLNIYSRGRVGFIEFFSEIFDANWKDLIYPQGLPPGESAAAWIFDRLTHYRCAEKHGAVDLVLNELNIPLLQSATLRSLRICGRSELIDQYLRTADSTWLSMKCLMERIRTKENPKVLSQNLMDLVEASPRKGDELLHRVIAEFGNSGTVQSTSLASETPNEETPPDTISLDYDEAIRVLSGTITLLQTSSPIILKEITAEQCERLIILADPARDLDNGIERYIPSVQFMKKGYVVAQRQVTHSSKNEPIGSLIRPAIAAANDFKIPMPWHQESLEGVLSTSYISRYLSCLGLMNDSTRFYKVLEQNQQELIVFLCNFTHVNPVLKYIDSRIVPVLKRYASSGTDAMFEGLCMLALKVETPSIDPVLAALFHRWAHRFNMNSFVPQQTENFSLWRAFSQLTKHPRFNMIEGWQPRLSAVLQTPLQWYHAEDIVRVLERDPRSYILIESRLFKTANWEHFRRDEIDRLDSAAEQLFKQLHEK